MTERYVQPSWVPTRKVAAGVVCGGAGMTGGAATMVWALSLFDIAIPNEPAIFICGMIGKILGGYMTTERVQGTESNHG